MHRCRFAAGSGEAAVAQASAIIDEISRCRPVAVEPKSRCVAVGAWIEIIKRFDKERRALSKEEIAGKSRQIFEKWLARFTMKPVRYLHVFQPIERRNEIHTFHFMDYVRNKHAQGGITATSSGGKMGPAFSLTDVPASSHTEKHLSPALPPRLFLAFFVGYRTMALVDTYRYR